MDDFTPQPNTLINSEFASSDAEERIPYHTHDNINSPFVSPKNNLVPAGLMTVVGKARLDTPDTTLTIDIDTCDEIILKINVPDVISAPDILTLQFNGDTGNNYGYRAIHNTSLGGGQSGKPSIQLDNLTGATANMQLWNADIANNAATDKILHIQGIQAATGNVIPDISIVSGKWVNSAGPITTILLSSILGSTLPAGTMMIAYGITF